MVKSNTLATWCEEQTYWKRPWCLERLRARREEGDRGWEGGITNSRDMSLSKLPEMVKDRKAWCASVYGSQKSDMTEWLYSKTKYYSALLIFLITKKKYTLLRLLRKIFIKSQHWKKQDLCSYSYWWIHKVTSKIFSRYIIGINFRAENLDRVTPTQASWREYCKDKRAIMIKAWKESERC